jgi:hypothetical protein
VAENLTVDYFPIADTPISRRDMFAWYVAKLHANRLISLDTAASYLRAPQASLENHLKQIRELRN